VTPRASAASIQQGCRGYKRKIIQFEGVRSHPATGCCGARVMCCREFGVSLSRLPPAAGERMKVRVGKLSDACASNLTLPLSFTKERRPFACAALQLPAIRKRPLTPSLTRTIALHNSISQDAQMAGESPERIQQEERID